MRCVKEKIGDLKFLAKKEDLDIVTITEECWNDKNQYENVIPGNKLNRKDRLGHRAGGAVLGLYC